MEVPNLFLVVKVQPKADDKSLVVPAISRASLLYEPSSVSHPNDLMTSLL